jgi:hypothetical protein
MEGVSGELARSREESSGGGYGGDGDGLNSEAGAVLQVEEGSNVDGD